MSGKLNWRKYQISENDQRTLSELKERKINRMMVDLNSAENVMKMKQCLVSEIGKDTTPEMIDDMLKGLFDERIKQVVELEGRVSCQNDHIDGKPPAVIEPPPGLGLFDFRTIKSGTIHQFEVWCNNANSAKFVGMLVLNKGRHDKIMKINYLAHPMLNGLVILMVETDDQFYFGGRFVEGVGQMQMLKPAVKYMEKVIGVDAGQEWRTKCWNSIDAIKDTECSDPTIREIGSRLFAQDQMPGFGKFAVSLQRDPSTIFGTIPVGASLTTQEVTNQKVRLFIQQMNYLIDIDGTDGPDGPQPKTFEEQVEADIADARGDMIEEPTPEQSVMDVESYADPGDNGDSFFINALYAKNAASAVGDASVLADDEADDQDDTVFLPPCSTPKRKRKDEDEGFKFNESQRTFKSLFPVAFEVTVPWKEPCADESESNKTKEDDDDDQHLENKVRVVNPMGLKLKIPFKQAAVPKEDSTVMLKYEIFKGPKADLIIDGDKITFVKHDDEEQRQELERKAEEKKRKEQLSAETSQLIRDIQDHYQGIIRTPTTGELAKHLKKVGDDLEDMSIDVLERRVNLWGFFQKTEGDLDDYFKHDEDGLPERLLNNELFYNQWKGKKMLEIIMYQYDQSRYCGHKSFTPLP